MPSQEGSLMMKPMITVYTSKITPRLQYILEFIGKELFIEPIILTTNPEDFISARFKLNYSNSSFNEPAFNIYPVSLLFESGISEEKPDVFEYENAKAIFQTTGDYSFDIFAASFFLLSRYEEYLPHTEDEYGRYAHTNSLAFRENFLHLPVINIWLGSFKKALQASLPEIRFKHQQFTCNLTYDIDIAYSYLHKGLIRTLAGFLHAFAKGKWTEIADRWLVLRRKKQDPYDCYEWLDALHLYCRLKPTYFFLVAKQQLGYDRNISTDVKEFRDLIEYYCSKYEVGLHPSWQSGDNKVLLKEELEWLEVVADKPVQLSRQHYIRFTTPETFRTLINAGIRNDFSMGYGSINGFRASVCSSYKWYDLEEDQATDLNINPYCFMDANSYFEQKQTPEQTYLELIQYYETIKKLNGNFISIWHNNILADTAEFKAWRKMFELFMRETVYWDAYSNSPVS
jgi:hypothetical protein